MSSSPTVKRSDAPCDHYRAMPGNEMYCCCGWAFEIHGLRAATEEPPKPCACNKHGEGWEQTFIRKLVTGQPIPFSDFHETVAGTPSGGRIYLHPQELLRYYSAPVGTRRHIDALVPPTYGDDEEALIDHARAAGHASCTATGLVRRAMRTSEELLRELTDGELSERYPRLQLRLAVAVHEELAQLLKEWDDLHRT